MSSVTGAAFEGASVVIKTWTFSLIERWEVITDLECVGFFF